MRMSADGLNDLWSGACIAPRFHGAQALSSTSGASLQAWHAGVAGIHRGEGKLTGRSRG